MTVKAMFVQLVRLASDEYTVPKGTIGAVEEMHGDWPESVRFTISWVGPPEGPGGTSVPVYADDMEVIGTISLKIPKEYFA